MSEYTINKGIPIPLIAVNSVKYPFAKMEVGDSFDICEKEYSKLKAPASRYGKRHNKFFTVRKTLTGGTCWRVK